MVLVLAFLRLKSGDLVQLKAAAPLLSLNWFTAIKKIAGS